MGSVFSLIRRNKRKISAEPINFDELSDEIIKFDYKQQYPLCTPRTLEKIRKHDVEFHEFMNGSFKRWQKQKAISMKAKNPLMNTDDERYKILFYLN